MTYFKSNSCLKDAQNSNKFGDIFKYSFFSFEDFTYTLNSKIEDTTCGTYALESFNVTADLYTKNLVKLVHISNEKKYLTLLHFSHNDNRIPVIVVAGGGYFCVCNMSEGIPAATKLYEKGFDVFVLNYSVMPKALEANGELALSIKFIIENENKLKINASKYCCLGFSAGGHLVSQIGTYNHGYTKYNLPKPYVLGLIYPVINFKDYSRNGDTTIGLFGKEVTDSEKFEYSSNYFVDESYPDTFIIGSNNDSIVDSKNFTDMKKALDEHNIRNYFHLFDSDVHGFSLNENHPANGWINDFTNFIFKK